MRPICMIVLFLIGACLALKEPSSSSRKSEVGNIKYRPWQGSINKGFDFVCGCTLYTPEWAVTAASCVQSPPYNVHFGSVDRTEGTVRVVQEIIVHEDFKYDAKSPYKYSNNIALLRFAALDLSFAINTIPMGSANQDHCYFTGWGTYDYSDTEYPVTLKEASVDLAIGAKCDTNSQTCTTGQSICWGDTGGPLVCVKDGEQKVVGISSWHAENCSGYSVYTRMSYFQTWINRYVRKTEEVIGCYQCNGEIDKFCNDPFFTPARAFTQCPTSTTSACQKMKVLDVVVRTCSSLCKEVNNKAGTISCCTEDGCNSGIMTSFSVILTMASLLLVFSSTQ